MSLAFLRLFLSLLSLSFSFYIHQELEKQSNLRVTWNVYGNITVWKDLQMMSN